MWPLMRSHLSAVVLAYTAAVGIWIWSIPIHCLTASSAQSREREIRAYLVPRLSIQDASGESINLVGLRPVPIQSPFSSRPTLPARWGSGTFSWCESAYCSTAVCFPHARRPLHRGANAGWTLPGVPRGRCQGPIEPSLLSILARHLYWLECLCHLGSTTLTQTAGAPKMTQRLARNDPDVPLFDTGAGAIEIEKSV